MAFVKSFVTLKGLALITEIVQSKSDLKITSVVGGFGTDSSQTPSIIEDIQNILIQFQTNDGCEYIEPNKLKLPLYFENSQEANSIAINEIGVYAETPSGEIILLAIATSYEEALFIPAISEGRLELTCNFTIELSLTPDVVIELPTSIVYLTRPEAMKLFWIIGEKYSATEITESVGATTEDHQRWQDEQIKQILNILESGSSAGTKVDRPTTIPILWEVIDDSCWYDKATEKFRA